MSDEVDHEPTTNDLFSACVEVAQAILGKKASPDVIETVAGRYYRIACDHQDFVRTQRETDDVIANAVRYLANTQAIPPMGTDTAWFMNSLGTLIELAVPNTMLDQQSERFLNQLQEGIREARSAIPIDRESLALEDDDVQWMEYMKSAGVEYGAVSEVLDLLERMYHGWPLDVEQQRLLQLASLAAPITRHHRKD
jgi:hypothetical protein